MAAVTPPTLEQVVAMRESIKNSETFRVVCDSGSMILDSTQTFLIWDDQNQMIHAIAQTPGYEKVSYKLPYRIMHIPYDQIEAIYANIK